MKTNKITHGQIISRKELTRSEHRRILEAVSKGEMVAIRGGLYSTIDSLTSSMVDIDKIVPEVVLCLYSAWAYYDLTTQIPDSFYVAIDRSRKVRLPEFPQIRLIFVSPDILDIGAEKTSVDGINVMIYDIERCVCDALKYRNKIGIDVMAEILGSYLRREDRNIRKLSEYATKLRVSGILKKYLEVKL